MTIAQLAWGLSIVAALFLAGRAWPVKARNGGSIVANASMSWESSDVFTVGTYNIHRARGLDGRKDLHALQM